MQKYLKELSNVKVMKMNKPLYSLQLKYFVFVDITVSYTRFSKCYVYIGRKYISTSINNMKSPLSDLAEWQGTAVFNSVIVAIKVSFVYTHISPTPSSLPTLSL